MTLQFRPRSLLYPAIVSLAALGLLFGLVGSDDASVSPARLLRALRGALPGLVALYAVAQVAQAALRARRAQLLVRSGAPDCEPPGYGHFFWVTLARNMFVDMLPARIGELSYVGMLNRGYNIGVDACLSSLSIGLLFDFLALLIVLGFAIPAAAQGASLAGSFIILALVCALGYLGLFRWLPRIVGRAREALPRRFQSRRPVNAALALVERTAHSIEFARKSRILPAALGLSAGIRLVKYLGLYLLFLAVTRPIWPELAQASPWAVLVVLIASEGAAALPVPTFMSFGTYEAGGLVALTALGFSAADSIMALFTLHVASQIIDYAFGIAAFAVFSIIAPADQGRRVVAEGGAPCIGKRGSRGVRVWLPLAFLAAAAVFAGLRWREFRRLGALAPPASGQAVNAGIIPKQNPPGFAGRIVWSSNRGGSHDLWMLDFPGDDEPVRLTSHPHTETYPQFSPDGQYVSFCRSREPWVSQRNPNLWDVFVLDLASGKETLIARNGFTPSWGPDGESIVFVRSGAEILQTAFSKGAPGATITLAAAGQGPFPEGVVFQTPSLGRNGLLALTLRGKRREQVIFDTISETLRSAGGGCQLNWRPDGSAMVCVDKGGRGGNTIFAVDGQTGEREALLDADNDYSHEYFPRVSRDSAWLVFGASTGGHEHDTADYEIFLWKIGAPQDAATRITAHTGNDCWPDIWVPPVTAKTPP